MIKNMLSTFLILLFSVLFLSSCSSFKGVEGEKIEEQSNEIIRCLTQNDREGFIALFSAEVQKSETFLQEIDNVFSFFDCSTYTTSEIQTTATGGLSKEHGEITSWYVIPEIVYIKTIVIPYGNYSLMDDRYYNIKYYWQITDKENPESEGIRTLDLSLLNIEGTVQVGTDKFDK